MKKICINVYVTNNNNNNICYQVKLNYYNFNMMMNRIVYNILIKIWCTFVKCVYLKKKNIIFFKKMKYEQA